MAGVESMRRADRPNVLIAEQLALFHILHHEQRAAKYAAARFLNTAAELNFPESPFGGADFVHHGLKFLGLQREFAVGTFESAGQRNVLLNNAGSERHSSYGNRNAQGEISQACENTEAARHFRNSAQIHVIGRIWISDRGLKE